MNIYYKFMSWISQIIGRNTRFTPVKVIKDQLNEKRELPLGREAFETWSDRIISGACIHGATPESIKFALADQLLHLGPTVDFESDLYFIKCLRKFAINQVADSMRHEIRDAAKARLAAQQSKLEIIENKPAEVTAPSEKGVTNGQEILSNQGIH
jgi:hypothetical protein